MTRTHTVGLAEFALAAFWLLLLAGLAMTYPAPMPQRMFTAPPQPFARVRGGAEIAHYNDRDRVLEVTEHAPRDLLVCMRGTCHLVEEWVEK
jgi:hypothetical protein